MKWLIGPRLLAAVPPQLQALLDEGLLQEVQTAPGEVLTRLAEHSSWVAAGPRVRSALFQALTASGADYEPNDAVLLAKIEEILQNEVAPVADSHGGEVTANSVEDGVLTVRFGGACRGCSASGKTLSDLVLRSVQARFPQIKTVQAVNPQRTWLPLGRPRHRQSC